MTETWDADKFFQAHMQGSPAKKKGRSKFGAVRTVVNGVSYASKAEAARAAELDLMLSLGQLRSVVRQPRFELGVPENVYVADFLVTGLDGAQWVEDVKGFRTPKFARDVKLWKSYGPHELRILAQKGRSWKTEAIPAGPKQPVARAARRSAKSSATSHRASA
jgi:hypothetical protein